MPIYAFACNNCGHLFDKLQKLSDPDPDACPACGASGTVHRRLTAPQFRLAGDGGDAKPAESKPEAKPAAEGKPASTAKPDPAPKPASKAD